MSRSSAIGQVGLPESTRSTSKQATAQRSGTSRNWPVSCSAASPTARARSTAPALHSAAANTTSLLARCRADAVDRGRSQFDRHLRVADRDGAVVARHRQLRGDPRAAHRQPVRRLCHYRVGPAAAASPRRPAARRRARRPPARSTHRQRPRDRRRPAPMRDRPSHGPGCASPAGAETRPACCAPARQADRTACRAVASRGRCERCRSDPARLRRPHVATADAVWPQTAAASAPAGPRRRWQPRSDSIDGRQEISITAG